MKNSKQLGTLNINDSLIRDGYCLIIDSFNCCPLSSINMCLHTIQMQIVRFLLLMTQGSNTKDLCYFLNKNGLLRTGDIGHFLGLLYQNVVVCRGNRSIFLQVLMSTIYISDDYHWGKGLSDLDFRWRMAKFVL